MTASQPRQLAADRTYHEHVSSRRQEILEDPVSEGRAIYFGLMQMVAVLENGFSLEARLSFPRMRYDFSKLSLMVWITGMHAWFKMLSRDDKERFRSSILTSKGKL